MKQESPQKWLIDTNIFDKIIEDRLFLNDLPVNISFAVTHIQLDELKNIPDRKKAKREQLLSAFYHLAPENVPTESSVWDVSRWDNGNWTGNDNGCQKIVAALDAKKRKPNNLKDALIGETALKNGYGLITADVDFADVMIAFGVEVIKVKQIDQP